MICNVCERKLPKRPRFTYAAPSDGRPSVLLFFCSELCKHSKLCALGVRP